MKKRITALFLLLSLAFWSLPSAGSADQDIYTFGDYEYMLDKEGNAVVWSYRGEDSNPVVPGEMDGYTVTAVSSFAFRENIRITGAVFPDSVTEIRGGAFKGCKNLASFTIPGTVTKIWEEAFKGCVSLRFQGLRPADGHRDPGHCEGDRGRGLRGLHRAQERHHARQRGLQHLRDL